jgi:predicted alpha/beta superfamily hydrolase
MRDYTGMGAYGQPRVVGILKVVEEVYSPQLGNSRDLLVYLPPSYYQGNKRYPVIYMHDGQNLFDPEASFAGEWGVDETLEMLSLEGLEAIAVGVPNMGAERLDEYSPFVAPGGGGKGDRYLRFLVGTVKPIIDREFRTLTRRRFTGILGSSMGGLISLYAFFRYPEFFGFAGAMSPAFWFANRAIFPYVKDAPYLTGKLYLDTGTREHAPGQAGLVPEMQARIRSLRHLADTRLMEDLLLEKGYRSGQDLLYLEEKGALHEEAAWARRLPQALRFLLAP